VTWMPTMAFRHKINQSEMTCCFQILPWSNPVTLLESCLGFEIVRKLAETRNDHFHIYSVWLGLVTSTMALHIHLHSITYTKAVHDVLIGAMTWMRRWSYTGVNELRDNFKPQFVFQQWNRD
jgi:hypothetical protein